MTDHPNRSAASEGDISERLRKEAFEAVDWNGETMKQWDKIRALCAERDGSDLPRLMFESLIDSLSELMIDGANEIDRLRQVMRAPAQSVGVTDEIKQLRAAVEYWRLAAERRDERRERTGMDIPEAATLDAPEYCSADSDPLDDLIARFSKALLAKLKLARANGRSGWEQNDWEEHCQRGLLRHIEKGDPRDVAAYCAFAWHHGWITRTFDGQQPYAALLDRQAQKIKRLEAVLPVDEPQAAREAFKAGWYVNAAVNDQPADYLMGCEEVDWLEYASSRQFPQRAYADTEQALLDLIEATEELAVSHNREMTVGAWDRIDAAQRKGRDALRAQPQPLSVSEEERHAIEHARYRADEASIVNPDCCFDYDLVKDLVRALDRAYPLTRPHSQATEKTGESQ